MQQPSDPNMQLPQNPYKQNPQNNNFQQQQQNSSMQQQQQNSSMQQQFPNQSMQQPQQFNSNFQQPPQNINMQQQQQFPTMNEPIPNTNIPQQAPDQNIPQHPYQQQPIPDNKSRAKPSSMFTIKYNGATFLVDPSALYQSSLKFKELTQPFIQDIDQMREMHLDILNVQFTKRSINNFLRIVQKLPSDVKNSEMKEICEIAKMFKADEIYNTGLAFIQSNLDANFFVPDNKYDGSDGITYLIVQGDSNGINHDPDLDDAYFEDSSKKEYQGNYYKINDEKMGQNTPDEQQQGMSSENVSMQTNMGSENNNQPPQNDDNFDLNDHSRLHDPVYGLDQTCNNENSIDKKENEEPAPQHGGASEEDKSTELENKKYESIIYYLRVENHTFKCPIFKFVRDEKIIYTAKQKYEDIYIAEGGDIHIRNRENHVAHITQNDIQKFNKVNMKSGDFLIKYVNSGAPEHFSLDVSFPFKDGVVSWTPKKPRYDPATDKYYLNFHGQHHHAPLISSKNIVLQDKDGKATFIVRKVDRNLFEVECLPIIDPLIAFAISLSDIVGPYLDPYTNIEYLD